MSELNIPKMEGEIPKRKRGRPPKIQHPVNPVLEFPASHLTEQAVKELQLGYKILKDILNIPKIKALLDKPDESLFGLINYYDVIEKPMWFTEISRKYSDCEYMEVRAVIDDIRLVLENCYRFWGSNHKFVKQAYRVEKLLEKHIKDFPEHLRPFCSLSEYDESSLETEAENTSSSFLNEVSEYNSKVIQNLEKKKEEENSQPIILSEELVKWESEYLMGKQSLKQICFMPELAEVGFFLRLAKDVLCIKEVTQYEIERMLLISQDSLTLATIMTCFLCPTAMRGSLYFKPIMIYEVWVNLLNKKLESWYNSFIKYDGDKFQLFLKYGIDPTFWEIVGRHNPLANCEFQSLSLLKKTSILKALCTTMFHSNKKIEEYFNSGEESLLRGTLLYEDSKFEYYSLFSPEIRVYRVSKCHIDIDNIVETVLPGFTDSLNREEEIPDLSLVAHQKLPCSRKQKFYLVASNKENLRNLLKIVSKKRKAFNIIQNMLENDESERQTFKGLSVMFNQWKKSFNRSSAVIESSFNYWINKDTSPSSTPHENGYAELLNTSCERSCEIVLGKRVLKRKFSLEDVESSSNDEKCSEGSVSDWEDGNIRRSKRIKRTKTVPRFFDRRFMKFERKNFDENIFHPHYQNYSFSCNPFVKVHDNIAVENNFRFLPPTLSKGGVKIRKYSLMNNKKSIVNAAVENATKINSQVVENESTVLTIDMGKKQNTNKHILEENNTKSERREQLPWMFGSCYPQILKNTKFFSSVKQLPLQNQTNLDNLAINNISTISSLRSPLTIKNHPKSPNKTSKNLNSSVFQFTKQINIPAVANCHPTKQINLPVITMNNDEDLLELNELDHSQQVLYIEQPPQILHSNQLLKRNLMPNDKANLLHFDGPPLTNNQQYSRDIEHINDLSL